MRKFFGKNLLLHSQSAKEIYREVRDLPIIDYHCHLDPMKIRTTRNFRTSENCGWRGDHYKWRAMRLCGVSEEYITGGASYRDKFLQYANILPRLAGNPLYYWTHMELSQVFGIDEPLNAESAARIYDAANEKLHEISVSSLLKQYRGGFCRHDRRPLRRPRAPRQIRGNPRFAHFPSG